MPENIYPENKKLHKKPARRSQRSKKKQIFYLLIKAVKRDPFKIFSIVLGGLLLIIITILFILYTRDLPVIKSN